MAISRPARWLLTIVGALLGAGCFAGAVQAARSPVEPAAGARPVVAGSPRAVRISLPATGVPAVVALPATGTPAVVALTATRTPAVVALTATGTQAVVALTATGTPGPDDPTADPSVPPAPSDVPTPAPPTATPAPDSTSPGSTPPTTRSTPPTTPSPTVTSGAPASQPPKAPAATHQGEDRRPARRSGIEPGPPAFYEAVPPAFDAAPPKTPAPAATSRGPQPDAPAIGATPQPGSSTQLASAGTPGTARLPHALIYSGMVTLAVAALGLMIVGWRRRQW